MTEPPSYFKARSEEREPSSTVYSQICGDEEFKPNASGKLVIKNGPSGFEKVFMLPFPFFCAGCYASKTIFLTFDDKSGKLTVRKSMGMFTCYKTKPQIYSYEDIATIKIIENYNCISNGLPTQKAVLVLSNGKTVDLTSWNGRPRAVKLAMKLHKFLFNKDEPLSTYEAPKHLTMFAEMPMFSPFVFQR